MKTKKVRWGILGCGGIAAKFAEALGCVDEAELVAVGSRTDAKAATFGAAYRVPRCYGSYRQLADDAEVDVIYIATPHNLHAENAMLCLNAGKHILCEKPLAVNAEQGRAMIDCARANQRFLMEAMWTRFLPLMERVRQLLADGAIGQPQMLAADFGIAMANRPPKPRFDDPLLAGGALLDVGVYTLALSSMVFGAPQQIHSAAAFGRTGVDDRNAVILVYDGGRLAMLYSAHQTETPQEATIMGTEGMMRLHRCWYRGHTLTLTPHGGDEQAIELTTHDNGFVYQIRAVHENLRQGRLDDPQMPLAESLSILETMDAIREQWNFRYPCETP